MKEIPLTKGFVALVDDEDFEKLSQVNWKLSREGYAIASNSRAFTALFGPGWPHNVLMHRVVFGAGTSVEVDHRDRCRVNNQKANLREADKSKNQMNSKSRPGTSEFKGVCWVERDQKWRANLVLDGRQVFLGIFRDERAAARAYDSGAAHHFKEFACLNFPDEHPLPYTSWRSPVKSLTGYIGVTVSNKGFAASCKVGKRQTYLGVFESPYDAALYRDHYLNKHALIGRRNFEL